LPFFPEKNIFHIFLNHYSTYQTFCLGGLDDFGGDYGEYMNLLNGNSMLEDFGTPGVGGGTDDIEKGQVAIDC